MNEKNNRLLLVRLSKPNRPFNWVRYQENGLIHWRLRYISKGCKVERCRGFEVCEDRRYIAWELRKARRELRAAIRDFTGGD
jgi:hypothetical protein